MTKEKLTLEIIERLKKEYPDAGCTLDYEEADVYKRQALFRCILPGQRSHDEYGKLVHRNPDREDKDR